MENDIGRDFLFGSNGAAQFAKIFKESLVGFLFLPATFFQQNSNGGFFLFWLFGSGRSGSFPTQK